MQPDTVKVQSTEVKEEDDGKFRVRADLKGQEAEAES